MEFMDSYLNEDLQLTLINNYKRFHMMEL